MTLKRQHKGENASRPKQPQEMARGMAAIMSPMHLLLMVLGMTLAIRIQSMTMKCQKTILAEKTIAALRNGQIIRGKHRKIRLPNEMQK